MPTMSPADEEIYGSLSTEISRKATEQLELLHKNLGPIKKVLSHKEFLIQTGKTLWNMTYCLHPNNDSAARDAMLSTLKATASDNIYYRELLLLCLADACWYFSIYGSTLWCHCGFPQLVLGHKTTASLLVTSISEDVLDLIHPPWRSFYIELPSEMFSIVDAQGNGNVSVRGIHVFVTKTDKEYEWSYVLNTSSDTFLWAWQLTIHQMWRKEIEVVYSQATRIDITKQDEKVNLLIRRLILNVCLYMTDKSKVKGPSNTYVPGTHVQQSRAGKEPRLRTYIFNDKPVHDFRGVIKEYLDGTNDSPEARLNYQKMVIGHWKSQAYGPNHSLRRPQRIEPYWRGRIDAPILVRPKQL